MNKELAHPDHSMIAWAATVGGGRWNPYPTPGQGEFCIAGFCYATKLDDFGVPEMTPNMRRAIAERWEASQ